MPAGQEKNDRIIFRFLDSHFRAQSMFTPLLMVRLTHRFNPLPLQKPLSALAGIILGNNLMQKHVCPGPPQPNSRNSTPSFPLQCPSQKTGQPGSEQCRMIQSVLQYLDLPTFIILSRQGDHRLVIQETSVTYF